MMQTSIKNRIEAVKLLVPLPSSLAGVELRQIINYVRDQTESGVHRPVCIQLWKEEVSMQTIDWCLPSLGQLYIRHLRGQKS